MLKALYMRVKREVEEIEVPPTQIVSYAHANGLAVSGRHHAIYLSDPRRILPGKLKTVLRLPVKPI